MSLKHIQLPSLHLEARHGCLELRLQSFICLVLADGHRDLATYKELTAAVENDHLWIARKGFSRLTLCLTNMDQSLSCTDRALLKSWIQEHEIWERLGIRLVDTNSMVNNLNDDIVFSIQHPDLSSASVAPLEAWTAEFRELKCLINISDSSIEYKKEPQKSKKSKKSLNRQCHAPAPRETSPDEMYEHIALRDQQAIDDFMTMLTGENRVKPKAIKRMRVKLKKPVDDIRVARTILEAAVSGLLFGGSRKLQGFKTAESSPLQGMASLAPGVFNGAHLKVILTHSFTLWSLTHASVKAIAERTSLLGTISTSLARMIHAESPALRKMTLGFDELCSEQSLASELSRTETVTRGIEKGLWGVVLAHAKAPSLRSPPGTIAQAHRDISHAADAAPLTETTSDINDSLGVSQDHQVLCLPNTLQFFNNSFTSSTEQAMALNRCSSPVQSAHLTASSSLQNSTKSDHNIHRGTSMPTPPPVATPIGSPLSPRWGHPAMPWYLYSLPPSSTNPISIDTSWSSSSSQPNAWNQEYPGT